MNFCEGFYKPEGLYRNATKNITDCSVPKLDFWFDPGTILSEELKDNITLTDLHWPARIDNSLHDLKEITHGLLGVLITGLVLEGLLFLTSIAGIFESQVLAVINTILAFLAFLFVGISAGISTAVIVRAVADINDYGEETGIAAYRGTKYLGMTWAAVGLLLVAAILAMISCCRGRPSKRHRHMEKP
jgi:hypothetical protein